MARRVLKRIEDLSPAERLMAAANVRELAALFEAAYEESCRKQPAIMKAFADLAQLVGA